MDATPTLNTIPLNPGEFETLAHALDYAAEGQTGFNFYSRKGELYAALPYSRIRSDARKLARRLLGLGLDRGSRVAIVAVTHPDFVRFFFACQYAGLLPVPLPAGTHLNGADAYTAQLSRLISMCGAKIAVSTEDLLPYLVSASEGQNLIMAALPEDFDSLPESSEILHPLESHEIAYLQFTSGSTRFPKGVMITQSAVMSNLAAITGPGIRIRPGDRAVSWLPFYHDMGLVGLMLASMASQVSVDFFSTIDFVMRPRLWLKLMSENQATVSFGPPFSYELAAMRLKPVDVEGLDLSNWRIAGIGAEMIRMESLEKFARCLRPAGFDERAFIPCYGMAECSLAVTFAQMGEGVKTDTIDAERLAENNEVVHVSGHHGNIADAGRKTTFVRCGRPLPSFDVEIRDENGNIVPDGMCGTLFLRGPSIMSGYFGDSNATKEVLSEDGWLNTGDIAYWSAGEIVITGRSKDLIIINGRNIWPQDIEYLAEAFDGIRAGDACAFSCRDDNGHEQAVLLVQSRITDIAEKNRLAEQLKRMVLQELGIDCTVELVPRNTLVRTTSGKPSRSGTRKVYLNMLAEDQAAA
jgi:fatty-acyl-CoA synthase